MVGESPGRVRAEQSRATPHPGLCSHSTTTGLRFCFGQGEAISPCCPSLQLMPRPCRVVDGRGTLSAF